MSEPRKFDLADAKDVAIRAVKTAIQVFIGLVGADVLGWVSVDAAQQAGVAALSAGAAVVINAVLAWATDTGD